LTAICTKRETPVIDGYTMITVAEINAATIVRIDPLVVLER